MTKAKENNVETIENVNKTEETETKQENSEQNAAADEQKPENLNIADIEVPEDAEEITETEAFALAADEVNKLTEVNTSLKQIIDANTEVIKVLQAEKEDIEQKLNAAEKTVKELEEKLATSLKGGNNATYIELLNQFEAKIDAYAGLRRERLRKEFVTDLKEEIQKQKDLLTNA